MGEPSQEFEPEPWGEDAKLVDALGEQGAAGFRALLDGFPEPVGVLWALRDGGGAIVDFTFGYGNPTMLRGFRIPAETPDRYTLLEALPPMRGSQRVRGVRARLRDGHAVRQRGDLRHAVRRRLHAREPSSTASRSSATGSSSSSTT